LGSPDILHGTSFLFCFSVTRLVPKSRLEAGRKKKHCMGGKLRKPSRVSMLVSMGWLDMRTWNRFLMIASYPSAVGSGGWSLCFCEIHNGLPPPTHLASLKSVAGFRQAFPLSQVTDKKFSRKSDKMVLAVDLLNPSPAAEAKKHKLKVR
jgi:hypothetical protein